MKMFRPALAGALPAFVLLVCIQLNARAASTPPPDMQWWFTGDDTVNDHIWQLVGTLYKDATYATARVAAPPHSRQLFFEDRVVYQRAIEEVYWRHRIWPRNRGERPDLKPSLEEVMSQLVPRPALITRERGSRGWGTTRQLLYQRGVRNLVSSTRQPRSAPSDRFVLVKIREPAS